MKMVENKVYELQHELERMQKGEWSGISSTGIIQYRGVEIDMYCKTVYDQASMLAKLHQVAKKANKYIPEA
jgi:hypothetical protein